jgi:glycolate oxidase FAD binding subunit
MELADRVRAELGPRAAGELAWPGRREPLVLALPASVDETAELVRWAGAERVPLVPVGLGGKLGWSRPPRGDVLALSMQRLQRIVEYEPGEGVITALAGTRMAALRDAARAQGHWLTPDVPGAERATLGGVVAAGQSGFDRLRHGPVRHHVLGVRVVMADGTVAKSGGRLVKNVTGFDLPKLFTGSRGTLGVIVEATLRLAAAPRAEALVRSSARDADELHERARAVANAPVRPIALVARAGSPRGGFALAAHLGGRAEAVQAELDALRALWPACAALEGDAAQAAIAEHRAAGFAAETEPWLHVACLPGALPRALRVLEEALREEPSAIHLEVEPLTAAIGAQIRRAPGEKLGSERWIGRIAPLRAELRECAATLAFRNPTRALADSGTPWPPLGPEVALMRRIRDGLDPAAVLDRGRFGEDL